MLSTYATGFKQNGSFSAIAASSNYNVCAAAQPVPDMFENKENTRSLLPQMSMIDAVIGQIRGWEAQL